MSFIERVITLVFTLGGTNTFDDTGSNQVTLTGLRVSCKISKTGYSAMGVCELRIWGLTPTVYNKLTQINQVTQIEQVNTVVVQAGDAVNGTPTVFVGQILIAQIDLNSQPESVMTVIAQSSYLQALIVIPPTSYPQGAPVDTVMRGLATQMQVDYENHGVTAGLPKMYLVGSARDQALSVVQAAGIQWNNIDNNVMAICPAGGSLLSKIGTPTISPDNGMIGYPSISNAGLTIKALFRPDVRLLGQIVVQSSLPVANGNWLVNSIAHDLESQMPGGQWFSHMQCAPFTVTPQ